MKTLWQGTLLSFLLLLYGCASPSFGIRVLEGMTREVYLTFPKGTIVNVGEVYRLYHVQIASAGDTGHGHHGGGGAVSQKHEVGMVQIVSLVDESHALVKILSGTAEEGVRVERVG